MQRKPSDLNALSDAATAWNTRARQSAIPILSHVHHSIQILRRLVDVTRGYGELDPGSFEKTVAGPGSVAIDPVRAFRELTSQLGELEEILDSVSARLDAAEQLGASLVRDFHVLKAQVAPDADSGERDPIQLRLSGWPDEGPQDAGGPDNHLLALLIEAQKSEIVDLHQQIADLKSGSRGRSAGRKEELARPTCEVEMQSVREFVQNSPIASVPVNASYYERILEAANSPEGHKVPMGEILTLAGLISERQLKSALGHQQDGHKKPLGTLLVDLGFTSEGAIAQALAAQLALPYVEIEREHVRDGAVALVPVQMARRHACFPLNYNDHSISVAMANPLDLIALEDLKIASGRHIRPCVASRQDIKYHISVYYP